jgi:two-component system NtrC family sensor kinase
MLQRSLSADSNAKSASLRLYGGSIGGAVRILHWLLVLSVVVPTVVLACAAWFGWREIYNEAIQQGARTAQILREHALKVFEAHEVIIDQIEELIRDMDWTAVRESEDVQRYLARLTRRQHLVTSIVLISPDGRSASFSNAFPAPAFDMSDRSYFNDLRHNRPVGTYISEPVVGRVTGNRVMIVARARLTPDGLFDGVITVSISLDRFSEFYRGIISAEDNSVTLVRADGTVLVRQPPATTGALKFPPAGGFMRAIQAGASTSRNVAVMDGIERIYSIVPVGHYPVYVSFGRSVASLRRMWLLDFLIFGAFAVAAAVALFSVSLLALRRVRNEQRLIEQWQGEVARRQLVEQTLRQSQKMEALGQLTGGVAHDFNNMLMVISGNVELLKTKAAGVGADRQIAAIEHAARNGETLTRKLLTFSRRRLVQSRSIELEPFVAKLIDLLKPSLPDGIELTGDIPAETWPVQADAGDLELSLVNIVLNARDAMPGAGRVTIAARNRILHADDPATDNLAGEFVALSAHDNGAGIAAEHLSRVFEPFFTTKEVGRGTGLGLSQVYGFAKQNGGAVTVASAPGEGTTVTLFLRRAEPASAGTAAGESRLKRGTKVLLVEDNEDVAEAATAMLDSIGCTVKRASAAQPALKLLAAGEQFDLVVTDIVMPGGIDGVELARMLRGRYPSLPVLLTTGYSNAAQKAAVEKFTILLKPYQLGALERAVAEAVGGGSAAAGPACDTAISS